MESLTPEQQKLMSEYLQLEGMIKKKRPSTSWLSKLDASVDRYFKFWCEGRFFVYYEKEKRGVFDKPKTVIFVKEI